VTAAAGGQWAMLGAAAVACILIGVLLSSTLNAIYHTNSRDDD
jgi:hypothetical protein